MKILLVILILVMSVSVYAHEDDNWKHMTGGSGPLIGQMYCGMGIDVWFNDRNSDGIVDECTAVFLAHDKFHLHSFETSIEENYLGEMEESCSCEVLANSLKE